MSDNPLSRYFRRPALWLRLPTGGRWYDGSEVKLNEQGEVRVFGMNAIDEIMLNTPDALFNGHALESVIQSCVPDALQVKRLLQPDLDAIFLAMRSASTGGKLDIDRKCAKCGHDNSFEVQIAHLLDRMTYVEDGDTRISINDQLTVHIRPYDFTMRNVMIQRQLDEQRLLKDAEDASEGMDDLRKAALVAEGIERISRLTFQLVAGTITSVIIHDGKDTHVTDHSHISEWLTNVDRSVAMAIVDAVNKLNSVGPPREMPIECQSCHHQWQESLSFDPALFFTRL